MNKLHQHYIRGNITPILILDEVDKYTLVKEENRPCYYIIDKEDYVYADAYLPGEDNYEQLMLNIQNNKDVENSKRLIPEQRSYQFFKKFLNKLNLDTKF